MPATCAATEATNGDVVPARMQPPCNTHAGPPLSTHRAVLPSGATPPLGTGISALPRGGWACTLPRGWRGRSLHYCAVWGGGLDVPYTAPLWAACPAADELVGVQRRACGARLAPPGRARVCAQRCVGVGVYSDVPVGALSRGYGQRGNGGMQVRRKRVTEHECCVGRVISAVSEAVGRSAVQVARFEACGVGGMACCEVGTWCHCGSRGLPKNRSTVNQPSCRRRGMRGAGSGAGLGWLRDAGSQCGEMTQEAC